MGLNVFKRKAFWYPSLMFGLGLYQQVVVQWTVFFYAPPDGASTYLLAAQIGTAMAIGRVVDAAADPFVAYFSDRASFHLGRRRPFMLYGTPFLLLGFILLWLPPTEGVSGVNFAWASIMLGLFFLSYSVIVVPYLALLPEIAEDEKERIRLSALQAAFYGGGAGLGFVLTNLLAPVLGTAALSVIVTPAAVLPILWCTYMTREESISTERDPSSSVDWLNAWRSVVRDPVFMLWIAVQGLTRAALIVFFMLFPYLMTVILGVTAIADISLSAVVVLALGSTVSCLYAYRAATEWGADAVYGPSLLISGAVVTAAAGIALGPLSSYSQLQGAILFSAGAGALGLILLLPNAVIADLARRRRQQQGQQWEALLYAVQGVVIKLCMGGGSAAVGFLLHFFGGEFTDPLGIRISLLTGGVLFIVSYLVFRLHLTLKGKGANKAEETDS